MGIFEDIINFIIDVLSALSDLIVWIGELAVKINAVDLQSSYASDALALYRYIVGDNIYTAHVTVFYISLVLMAMNVIGQVVSWWKKFSPRGGG